MELFGGLPLPLSLALLALLDSLSVGTLLIPVFLLLSPGRVRGRRILLYLGTIAGFYLLVGLLFLWGLVNVADVAASFLSSPAGLVLRLILGAALLVTALVMPTGSRKPAAVPVASGGASALHAPPAEPGDQVAAPRPGSRRITRWRDRLLDPEVRGTAVMGVAVAAGLVEVATMLPYIVGMTMLAEAGVSVPVRVLSLVGYCAIMILPAVLLLVLRFVAAPLVQRPLERLGAWMERTGAENTAWILGIIGFLVARSAASELGLFDWMR